MKQKLNLNWRQNLKIAVTSIKPLERSAISFLQLESVSQISIAETIVLHCVFKKFVNRARETGTRQIARLHLHYLVPSRRRTKAQTRVAGARRNRKY
jgi:hypothetical protein